MNPSQQRAHQEPLGAHLERPLDEARVSRLWKGVERRRAQVARSRGRRLALVAVAASLAAVGLALWMLLPSGPAPIEGMTFSATTHVQRVTLADGSRLTLEAGAALDVCRAEEQGGVCLDLRRGRARFAVTHVPERPFVVRAGGVQVQVVGTRFVVQRRRLRGGSAVYIEVEEGVVAVRGAGVRPRHLRAGERLRVRIDAAVTASRPSPAPLPWMATAPAASQPTRPPAVTVKTRPTSAPRRDQRRSVGLATKAKTPAAKPASPKASAKSAASPPPRPDAVAVLWQRARAARQRGDARGAARAYDALLRRHPEAAIAGLAAFELGRLHMDVLKDDVKALASLRRALSRRGNYHEHALARVVRLLHRLGRTASCKRARSQYLSRYPRGAHRLAVQRLCP